MGDQDPIRQAFEKINLQTLETRDNQVYVIELDGIPFKKISVELRDRLERFTSLQMLSLISCELNSLENFPHLPQLIRLDLVNNELSGDDIKHIVVCKHVQTVMLSHNQITSADDLKPLVPLKELTQLDFYGNPVVNIAEYRKRVFTLLPRLQILDSQDREGEFKQQSMNQAVERIPQNLFERRVSDAQAIVIRRLSATTVQQAVDNARKTLPKKAPIKKEATKKTATAPVAAAAAIAPPKKARAAPAERRLGGGKQGFTKKRTVSSRAGLIFPCGRVGRLLKQIEPNLRISSGTKVYMAAVLEYLACEVIELAGKAAKDNRKRRILPVHLKLAMRYDEEISKFLGNSVLAEGGGVHSNFSIDLLQTKKTTTKASSNDT